MFALVEPLMTYGLTDRPNLGCAMLVASCRAEGIPVTLVPGETRRIREIFLEDAEALFDLVRDVRDDMAVYKALPGFRREVMAMGRAAFRDELADLYGRLVVAKRLRDYLNPVLLGRFQYLHRLAMETYFHHIRILRREDLGVVRRTVSDILACRPDAAGFSVYSRFDPLTRAVRRILRRETAIPLIVGGPLTPHLKGEKRLRALGEESFDYLVEGHAERALPALLQELGRAGGPRSPGVSYLREGRMVENPVALPADISALPAPDFSQCALDAYLSPRLILPLLTARGCSWRACTFCSHHAIDQDTYRPYRTDRILETLKTYRERYGCRHVALHDEEIPPRRVAHLCRTLLANGMTDFRFNLYSKMHRDFQDEGLADLMRRAGFRMAHWGLESASQRVLDRMRKGTDVPSMERILHVQSRHGIANCCFVLFGFPGETREDALETVRFLERNREAIDVTAASTYVLQPGTAVGEDPLAFGVTVLPGGAFTVREGMQPAEVDAFRAAIEADGVRLQSDRYYCLAPDTASRMAVFLISCQGALRGPALDAALAPGAAPAFPLLLGRLREDGGAVRLSLVDVTAGTRENEALGRLEEALDPPAAAVAALADGSRSVGEIEALCGGEAGGARARLRAWALEHRLLVFSERWEPGTGRQACRS